MIQIASMIKSFHLTQSTLPPFTIIHDFNAWAFQYSNKDSLTGTNTSFSNRGILTSNAWGVENPKAPKVPNRNLEIGKSLEPHTL